MSDRHVAPAAAELAGLKRRTKTIAGRVQRKTIMRLRGLDPRPRRDPDFIVVGAQKGGTTSLLAYLTARREVDEPLVKEIQYFSLYYGQGRDWYRQHFTRARRGQRLAGEASPLYMVHPLALERIAADLPGVKVIAALRDPVDRLLSHYSHNVRLGHEPLPLAEALAREAERIAPDLEALERDPQHRALAFRRYSYVTRSLYRPQVERIQRLFPERSLFLRLEDLIDEDSLRPLCDFLGLPYSGETPFEAHNVNAMRRLQEIDPEVERRLRDDARDTCELLGWEPWTPSLGPVA